MSRPEKHAWWALASALAVWAYLAARLTEDWQIVALAPGQAIAAYVTVVVLMVVATSVPAIFGAVADRDAVVLDERDRAIDATADRWEGYVVAVAVNVLVIHALLQAAYPAREPSVPLPDLSSTTTLVFLLISALFLGHVAKQCAILWLYRR